MIACPALLKSQQRAGFPDALFTRAEKSQYTETSLSRDVREFVNTLDRLSDLVSVETTGTSKGGNPLQLVILARPGISTPDEAHASGKPVVYIEANIHAGEVEGKEAVLQLMREIAFGPKTYLLDNQIILFCPNFNPDGNDKLGENRPSQDGSPKLTGVRSSGEGLDLNREGMKLEAIEVKALVKNVFLRWDPVLFMDMHTDNGSWHGYAVNFAPSFHTVGQPEVTQYTRKLLQAAEDRITERSGVPAWWHGYYRVQRNGQAKYTAYSHLPRYLVNSVGLRNRMGILSETFAHMNFEKRVWSNYLEVESILEYTNDHAGEIVKLIRDADRKTVETIKSNDGTLEKGVRYKLTTTPDTVSILVRETKPYTDRRGRRRSKPTGRTYWKDSVLLYNSFEPVKKSKVPRAYLIPAVQTDAIQKLQEHGITLTQLNRRARFTGEEYRITGIQQNKRAAYGGHKSLTLTGSFFPAKRTFPAGTYLLDMAQPLAWLAFYLLEPESDDGLVYWNYFDHPLLDQGKKKQTYPVFKLFKLPDNL
ncbi:MAG: M14 family metallopeptidase [Bacteroidales bacterium]|nr:M14 family metallopeptidase [Bacteroidales bacterium]